MRVKVPATRPTKRAHLGVRSVVGFLIRVLLSTLAVLVASSVLEPQGLFHVSDVQTALIFALVLGLLNAIVRPILAIITFPLTILTLGLFVLVLNALVFWLASVFVPGVYVGGFLGAFLAWLITALVSTVANHFIR